MGKNNFLRGGSKVLLVPSLLGSFVPQNTKADDTVDLAYKKSSGSSFLEVWTITPKLVLACWWLSLREFLSNLFSKDMTEAEEKSTSVIAVKLEGEKAEEKVPKEFKQLQSALEKKFGEKISFWPYKGGEILGTVELYGGYELPFCIDFGFDKKVNLRLGTADRWLRGDKEDKNGDKVAETITKKFCAFYNRNKEVLTKMKSLEEKGLFVETVNKGNGYIYWEPTIRCKISLNEGENVYAIQYSPFSRNMYFVTKPYYEKILTCMCRGDSDLRVEKDNDFKLFNAIVSKIEGDYEKHKEKHKEDNSGAPFEVTIYDNLNSYDK